MNYELISNDHHNNNCALFMFFKEGKKFYKKVSFSKKGNITIRNEDKGYTWFFDKLQKKNSTYILDNYFTEIILPAFQGKKFPSNAIIKGNQKTILKFIEFYRNIWLSTNDFIIHGDLALCNIIINPTGKIYIIDWEHCHSASVDYFGFDIINLLFISVRHQFKMISEIDAQTKIFMNKCIKNLFKNVSGSNKILNSPFKNSSEYLKKFGSKFNLSIPIEKKFVLSRYDHSILNDFDKFILE